jgi:hypothetical protein
MRARDRSFLIASLFVVALILLSPAAIPLDAAAAPAFTILLDDGTTVLADGESPSPSNSSETTHGFVFRPRPLPVSRSYFVYDLGISAELGDSYSQQPEQTMLSLELGYMRNLTTKDAVGLGVIGMTGDQVSRLAVRGRYRRWLTSGLGLDGTLGLTVAGGGYGAIFPGGIASVGLQMEGIFGVTLEAEQARFQTGSDTHSDTLVRVRGQLGSWAGVVGTVFLVGLGIVYAASASGWD